MKDLVPESRLGSYFARRSSYTQALNAGLSLVLALTIDYVSNNIPAVQLDVYAGMFIAGGIVGLIGAFVLAKADEPSANLEKENVFRMLVKPLTDKNFIRLLVFNSTRRNHLLPGARRRNHSLLMLQQQYIMSL